MPNDNPLPPRKPSNAKIKQPSLRELFVNFNQEQTKFNQEQREFNKNINTRLDNVIKLNNLKE